MKSTFFYFMMYRTGTEGWKDADLAEMTIECIEALYEVYAQEGNEMSNFFLNGVTKKPPGKLKQQKILLSLIKLIDSLNDICSEHENSSIRES